MWRPFWINSKLTVMMVLVVGGGESGPMTQQGGKTEGTLRYLKSPLVILPLLLQREDRRTGPDQEETSFAPVTTPHVPV